MEREPSKTCHVGSVLESSWRANSNPIPPLAAIASALLERRAYKKCGLLTTSDKSDKLRVRHDEVDERKIAKADQIEDLVQECIVRSIISAYL